MTDCYSRWTNTMQSDTAETRLLIVFILRCQQLTLTEPSFQRPLSVSVERSLSLRSPRRNAANFMRSHMKQLMKTVDPCSLWSCLASRRPVVRRPHLAVPQRQLEHVGGAAEQTHPQAVQHHPLAAAEHGRGEVSGLQPADEPPEAGGHRLLGGRALHGRVLGRRRETWWEAKECRIVKR